MDIGKHAVMNPERATSTYPQRESQQSYGLRQSPSSILTSDLPHGWGPLSRVNDGARHALAPNSAPNAREQW